MKFQVKQVKKEEIYTDYARMCSLHHFTSWNIDLLPEYAFVCYADEIPIYLVWFWFTNSKMAIVTFILSNKGVNYKKRIGGMQFLITEVINYAKKKKQKMIYFPTSNQEVANKLIQLEFFEGDPRFGQYFYKL
jgi:hypothetical protein